MKPVNKRISVEIMFGLVLVVAALWVRGRVKSPWPEDRIAAQSGYRLVMGTTARIVVVAMDEQKAQEAMSSAFDVVEQLEGIMSIYQPQSELNKINATGHIAPVHVSKSLYEVIDQSVYYSKLTDGAFDITIGPLTQMWKQAEETNTHPDANTIAAVKQKIGYEKIILDPNKRTIALACEGMRLDLGAIATGYALDRAVEAMQKAGVIGGMIDIGGDVICFGAPPKPMLRWTIGVQDPQRLSDNPDDQNILSTLLLQNQAVTTSGNYRKFVTVKGKRTSHIIDPNSAEGADSLISVTIIAPTGIAADALATAVSVMGLEKGLALIETLKDTDAIIITAANPKEPVYSSGAKKLIAR